ncbi:MAG: putative glycine-rich autotransporter protein [Phycisphaerales bacterium]|nr:putative glycine-rich autotransporter protein [Phycisphaerales bacterium]
MKFASIAGRFGFAGSTSQRAPAVHPLRGGIGAVALVAVLALCPTAARAQNTWTAGSTTDTNWDTGTNWSLALKPVAVDDVIFPTPVPNPGGLGTPATITLTAGEVAKSLTFNDIYLLTGGDLTLAAPGSITVGSGATATIASNIIGASGLTKAGAGTLVLSGANTYTGTTAITGGVLSASVRTGANPLGNGAISLTGATLDLAPVANVATIGLSGRQFVSTIADTSRIDFTLAATVLRTDTNFNTADTTAATATQAIQWLGKVNITTGGTYTFGAASDDGSRLFIDGVLVVQNDGAKGIINGTSAGLNLSAGLHDIRFDYVNSGGNGGLNLTYNGPDTSASTVTIPSNVLFTAETSTLATASNAVIVGTGVGDALNISGNSTVNLSGTAFTQAQLGNTTFAAGSSLSLTTTAGNTGKALRIGGTTTFGAGVALNLAGDGTNGANLYFDGVVSDGGVATTITKTGSGRLVFDQTTAANGLVAGSLLDVQAGTLALVGTSATAFSPIGSAGVRLSGGTLVLDTKVGGYTLNNAITMTTDATIQDIASASTVTLTSALAIPDTKTLTIDAIAGGNPITSLGAQLNLPGALSGTGTLNVVSSNVGTLGNTPLKGIVNFSGNTSAVTGAITVNGGMLQLNTPTSLATASSITLNTGGLNLAFDGTGTGVPETIVYSRAPIMTGTGVTIGVNRNGASLAPIFPSAANKTIQIPWTTNGLPLTVVNNNGYSLEVTGATAMTANQTYNVLNATASNLGAGLIQTGKISGAFNVVKQGAGTLVLNNATNDFGGAGNLVDITGGVVAVASDAALGDLTNGVRLNANATTGVGLRATGTFATSRVFTLNQTSNAIEVTGGNILTINKPFSIPVATRGLAKNDTGILVLTQSNAGWTGPITINQGAILVSDSNALGSGPITVGNAVGAALQLANNVTLTNALNYSITGGAVSSGINYGGGLQSVSGNNTVTGLITQASGSALNVSADAGATLNILGGVTLVNTLYFGGAGNVNVMNTGLNVTANSVSKFGTGTTTLGVSSTGITAPVNVQGGTFVISGDGQLGSTGVITVNSGSTFKIDDSLTSPNSNRLSSRAMSLQAGNFAYVGNAGNSSENFGALTIAAGGGSSVTSNTTGSGTNSLMFTTLTFGADTAVTFGGAGLGTDKNRILIGTAPTLLPATTGLLARGIVTADGGFDFATYDTSVGIKAFTGYNATSATDLNAALAVDTVNVNAGMTVANLTATKTINALKITGNGLNVTGAAGTILTLTSAGVAVTGGNNTISVPTLATAGVQQIYHVDTGSVLNLNSTLTGTAGFVKADGGTLVLNAPANLLGIANTTANIGLTGNHNITGGTLRLGSSNAITPNSFLRLNPGATLDLGGNAQYVQALFNDPLTAGGGLSVDGAGGTVTGTAGSLLVANYDNTARQFGGNITGAVSFVRSGQNTQVLYSNNDYTGITLLNGGTTNLRDGGRLSATSAIDINYAGLTIDNNLTNPTGTKSLPDRVNDAAPITMRGSTILLGGRIQTDTRETLGAVTLADGLNVIDVQTGGTGINSSVLTLGSLSRPVGGTSTVIFGRADGTVDENGQLGSTARLLVTAAPTLSNNLVGPWAIMSREWASYLPTLGAGQLNANGFAGYSSTNLLTAGATDNVRITAGTTLTANETINTLNMNYTANQTINLGGKVLTLGGGGLMLATATNTTVATVSNGTLTSGFASGSGVNDLYLYHLPYLNTARTAVISAVVANNGTTPVRLIVTSSDAANTANRVTLSGANTYTGGTVINGGTVLVGTGGTIPAGGITINAGALSQTIAGQATPGTINAANVITLNGLSAVNLVNSNTLAGLVFNNSGGGVTPPTVNTFIAGMGTNGTGTLTLGASGITANSSNVTSTSIVQGRLDFGAAPSTVTVNPILVNGIDIAPLQAGLILQGISGSAGGITKAGLGMLQLNGQDTFTGPLNVTAGTVTFGALGNTVLAGNNVAGSRFSAMNLSAGTRLNVLNDGTIGSLSGAGIVTDASLTARTLNTGFDNTSTTFSGSFSKFTNALPAFLTVNKIGTGTMTLTGVSNDTGNLQVSQGGLTFGGAGMGVFGTGLILPTGTLTLDNSGTNVNNRLTGGLGTGGTLTVGGGQFRVVGNSGAPTIETIGTLNIGFTSAANPYGNSTVTLVANAAQPLTLNATAFGAIPIGSSSLIRGVSGVAGNGLANLNIGTAAFGAPAGSGVGGNGTTVMGIRPDILGDASATGIGTAFLTKDSVTNFLRPLAANELANALYSGVGTPTVNYGVSSIAPTSARTIVGSLTLNGGGGVATDPGVVLAANAPDGLPTGLVVNSGGILALAGSSNLNVNRLETLGNLAFHFHTQGDLTVSGTLFGTSGGLNKGDAGTLTLNSRNLYTGQTQINAGKLVLNGGDNTLPLFITAGAPTTSPLGVNAPGATVDFNGTNQISGTFVNNGASRYAGGGGTITNSSATASSFTTILGTAQAFSGSLTGNLSFTKTGNTALTLSNTNTFTGATNIRANTLNLIDAGTLSNTSAINLFYGGLNIDQSGLNPLGNLNPVRVPAATPVNLRGGTLTLTSGGSVDSTATINTVNVLQGHSTFSVPQAPVGGYGALTIGNLARASNPDATVNFTGGAGSFFGNLPGLNNSSLFISAIDGVAIPATIPNKILGAWAIANNGEFATYINSTTTGSNGINWGVSTMNGSTGALGTIVQDRYDLNPTSATNAVAMPASSATGSVRAANTATTIIAMTASLPAGGANYNVLALRTTGITLAFAADSDVLNLTAGGLALTGVNGVVGSFAGNGVVTAGGTQTGTNRLYVYNNGAATFNSAIANNTAVAGAVTRLVLAPTSGAITINGVNTYTGGTVVNGSGGTVSLASSSSAIPAGGLTLNNVAVTSTVGGNIAASNDVTLNGGSSLTFSTDSTLNSLTFNNTGGTVNPTVVATTSQLTLTAINAITVVNDNVATVPTIAGSALNLPDGANINTSTTAFVPTNLVISAPIAGPGAINKTGTGSLDLTGASSFGGTFNLNAGTLMMGNSAALGSATLNMANGTALISDAGLRTINNNIVLGGNVTFGSLSGANGSTVAANGVILTGSIDLGTGTNRTINVNSLLNVSTISGTISGAGSSLTKTGPGTLVLSGSNAFDGDVNINGGTLQVGANALQGMTGASSVKFGGGIFQYPANTTNDYSGKFSTANNQPIYVDTGANTVTFASPITSPVGGSFGKFGTGTLILTSTANYDGATLINAGILQVGDGSLNGALPANTKVLDNGILLFNRAEDLTFTNPIAGSGIIAQGSPNTLTLNGSYAGFGGGVGIDQGTVKFTADPNYAGPLIFGTSSNVNTTGTVDLTNRNATFGGLLVQSNNTGSILTVGAGKTLTLSGTGNVTIGNTITGSKTTLAITGGGSLVVNQPGGLFRVGVGPTGTNVASSSTLDLAGLTSFTADLGAGQLIIGAVSDNQNATFGTPHFYNLLLAANANTVTAGILTVGGSSLGEANGASTGISPAQLKLGSGTNVFNLDTLNIGTGGRDGGTISFPSSTGSITVAGRTGAPVAVNMGTGTATTGYLDHNNFDMTGHLANLALGVVTIGTQGARTGTMDNLFAFDTGTLSMTSLTMSTKTAAATTNSTLNIGGGTATIGSGSGTAISLSSATLGTANSFINLTGGTTTITGNVIRTGGAGTTAATLKLSGGSLNMSGFAVGSTATPITSVFESGTLRNLGQLNGGGVTGPLTKTTLGTLNIAGNNGYTGATEVTAGTVSVSGSIAASSGVSVSDPTAIFEAAATQRIKALTVSAGGARVVNVVKSVLTVGDGTQATSQLSLTGGKLDLTTNGAAVDYAAGAGNDAAALASVRSQILTGFNPTSSTTGDGKWDGATGITSSSINSLTAVGYALASDVLPFANGATIDTFMGATVDKSTVLTRYTLGGDLNLDGAVDFLDLARLAQSYNVTDGTRVWATGDVNYDGNTDFLDLAKMAQNYNTALPSEPIPGASADFQADLAKAFAAVPEPGTISMLGIGAVALLARRRNGRRRAA